MIIYLSDYTCVKFHEGNFFFLVSSLPPDFEDFSFFDISKNCPITGVYYQATKDL